MKSGQNVHRNTLILLSILGIIAAPLTVLGADAFVGKLKGVSIKEPASTNQPPSPIINFKVVSESPYRVELDASGSTDADNAIAKYAWTIGDGATLAGAVVAYEFTSEASVAVTLAVTDEAGAISIIQKTITRPWEKAVNFQPANVPVPEGFVMDSGETFDAVRGYGWTSPPNKSGSRDRNSTLSPDQAYDTIMPVYPTSAWEIGIPNGTYTITVCMGDASYVDGTQGVEAEGAPVIVSKKTDSLNHWIPESKEVVVTDGRLTLTFNTAIPFGKICWLKIIQTQN